jgi:Fe-S oxidoreductase
MPVGDARPTGLQANSVGLGATARQLAQDVVDEIAASGVREVLVLSPGDRWTFEYVYPVRLGVAWPAEVRVTELTTALAQAVADRRLQLSPRADARPFAYHDPCHTARTARDGAAVRSLVAAVLGQEERRLFWREGRAHPCGAIGGLELTHPDIAAGLADARLAEAASAGAEWLVTEDPLCAAHLAGRGAPRLEVKSLFELLAAALPSLPELRYS